jgi:aminoglycoside phosphotransferase (APT) family kinase protein
MNKEISDINLSGKLEGWYRQRHGLIGAKISKLGRPSSGVVNETYHYTLEFVDGENQRRIGHVLRCQPEGEKPIARVDVLEQAQTLRALQDISSIPTPIVFSSEDDPSWLGRPFFVMARLPGEPIFDLNKQPNDPVALRELFYQAIDALACIHAVDWTAHCFAHLANRDGAEPLVCQIAYYRAIYDQSRGGKRYPLIERAFDWIEVNVPTSLPLALNWGDARIGNMLFDGRQLTGVLDWEIAEIAPREVDLGWFVFFERFYWPEGRQARPGAPTRNELIERYQAASTAPLADLEFFERWAALRLAIMRMRAGHIAIAKGEISAAERPDEINYATSQLALVFGWEVPS